MGVVNTTEVPEIKWGMTESLSAQLAPIVLPRSGGDPLRLGALWERGPAVIVFLRHYG